MATMQAATATHEAPTVTDPEAVHEILEEYNLGGINCKLEGFEEDTLLMWGYGTFSPWVEYDDGQIAREHVAEELMYRLSQYIAEGDKLDLRTAEHTKCCSVGGRRWLVFPNLVVFATLNNGPMVVTPPSELAEVMDEDALEEIGRATDPEEIDQMDVLPRDSVYRHSIGPGLPEHLQKYPESLIDELDKDARITKLDEEDDFWEFEAGDTSWRGSAGAVRTFAMGYDADNEA